MHVLKEIRAKIAVVERQEAAKRPRRTRPEGPAYRLSFLRQGGQPVADSVHVVRCPMAASHTKPLSDDQPRRAIAVDGITPCPVCGPDAAWPGQWPYTGSTPSAGCPHCVPSPS